MYVNFDAGSLFASLLVSSVGFVVFTYGRKQSRLPHVLIGIAMCGYPYLVADVAWMLGIAALLLGLLWIMTRYGW